MARLALGVMLLEVGQLAEARAFLDDALEAHRRAGSRHWEGMSLAYLARWKQEMGDLPAALALYPEALQHIEIAGVRRAQAVAWYHFATALIEAGELGAAAKRLRDALPLVRSTCPDHEGMILAAQGIIAARRGAADDAAILLRRAEESLRRYTRPMFLAAVRVMAGAEVPAHLAACSDVRLALRLRVPLTAERAAPPLLIARDGSWFRAPSGSASISLDRRKAIRGVLAALAQHRRDRPGEAAPLSTLVEAGWPGERIVAGAGAERVYAAVATLRRLGLRGVILQKGEGYLLSPEVPLVLG
jgi:tetratricopeptide (TPR) repeat protein